MNPADLTPDERRALIRQENMPARAYAELERHPSIPRAAYRRIALQAARRAQRAKTVKALAILAASVLFLAAVAALPYLLK